jgi:hypothetical protein
MGGMITGLDRDRSTYGLGRLTLRIRLENVLAEGDDPGDTAHADLGLARSDGQDRDGSKQAQTEEYLRTNLPDEMG